MKSAAQRDSTLDVIRIAAAFFVTAVHFFLNSGFYSMPISGAEDFVLICFRQLFICCVPLFLLLTGFLMNRKTLSRRFYSGLGHTLFIYIAASLATFAVRVYWGAEPNPGAALTGLLNFTTVGYAWYIEMYIGLFLLIPFLNLIWNNLKDRRQELCLIGTLLVLCSLPGFFNAFDFSQPRWWLTALTGAAGFKLLPAWWIGIYPLLYYFTGCYLSRRPPQLRIRSLLLLLAAHLLLTSGAIFLAGRGSPFVFAGLSSETGSPFIYIGAVLLFSLLHRIPCSRWPEKLRTLLAGLSRLSLGIYLMSFIFDLWLYPRLIARFPIPEERMRWFLLCPLLVFCASAAVSALLELLYRLLQRLWKRLVRRDSAALPQ